MRSTALPRRGDADVELYEPDGGGSRSSLRRLYFGLSAAAIALGSDARRSTASDARRRGSVEASLQCDEGDHDSSESRTSLAVDRADRLQARRLVGLRLDRQGWNFNG